MGSNQKADAGFTNLTRSLYQGDLLGLFDAGEQVEDLLAHPGWTHLTGLIAAELRGLDERLDGQLLPTRSDYARLTGRRSGLKALTEAARAIVSEASRQREQQRQRHEGAAETALGA